MKCRFRAVARKPSKKKKPSKDQEISRLRAEVKSLNAQLKYETERVHIYYPPRPPGRD